MNVSVNATVVQKIVVLSVKCFTNNMAVYIKKGFNFTKSLYIYNKEKDKALFIIQISIGINYKNLQKFGTSSNWIFLGAGFNIKKGQIIRGLNFIWNIKQIPII